jgi:FkbM family methyltransferase
MKSSGHFFAEYYFKKHISFLWGAKINATHIFWKNFYRLKAAMHVEIVSESPESFLIQADVAGKPFRSFIRKAPSSDIYVFRQVFENKEYLPLIELLQKNNSKPALIVDAGANVGYTALFFNLFFPETTIVTIEPDTSNANQIKQNLAANNINNTDIVIAGVWPHNCWLELKKDKSKGEEWGFYVTESKEPTNLKGVDILNLQQLKNRGIIDILKIDIEGSEAKLFEDSEKSNRLLGIVKYLAIEIHDDMASRQQIQQILRDNNFTWFEAGELTIAANQNFG